MTQPRTARTPSNAARLARRLERATAELHHAVGVGHRTVLLRPRRCRQDHVCVVARLGEEDLLHHEALELRERRWIIVPAVSVHGERLLEAIGSIMGWGW